MSDNMFKNMFGGVNAGDGIGDDISQLVLVEVECALTDYTHTPRNRAPAPYLPGNMMDELTLSNKRGNLTGNDIGVYSAHMGALNVMPGDEAKIMGGYQEFNKGLMKLKFRIQNGGIDDEYVSVIGYVTGNDVQNSISENAVFVPSFSWRHSSLMENHTGLDGLSFVAERIGVRTDYMLNDGSHSLTSGLATLRPTDVISAAGDNVSSKAVMDLVQLDGAKIPNPINGNGAINEIGVICSNRGNYNPTKYSKTLLNGSIRTTNNIRNGRADNNRISTTDYDSEVSVLSKISQEMLNREHRISEDVFLENMKNLNGTLTNLRGWRVGEVADMFPSFEEIISRSGCALLNSSDYPPTDFTEIAEVFGRSSPIETIVQEIVFNLLDVLISNGISMMSIEGSNCDRMADEDRLSNIVLMPYDITPLSNNDINAFQKGLDVCEDLKNQIFNKLNGFGLRGITPVRIELNTTLMGSTEIWITNMGDERHGDRIYYCFPTFAPTPYSPIFGDNSTLSSLSDTVYTNIKSYFLDNA